MLMMVNVDNITGDALPYLIDGIFSLGASNVNACSAITKKGRMGYIFFIDLEAHNIDPIMDFMVREVGTLGARVLESHHLKRDYTFQHVQVRLEPSKTESSPNEWIIAVKIIRDGDGILSARAEYRDLEAAVTQIQKLDEKISLAELRAMSELVASRRTPLYIGEISVDFVEEYP